MPIGITGRGADQINRRPYQFLRLAEPRLRRVRLQKLPARRPLDQLAIQIRRKNARRNPVHPNPILRPLIRQPPNDPQNPALGGRIRHHFRQRNIRIKRRNIYDRPALPICRRLLVFHHPPSRLVHNKRAIQIHVNDPPPLFHRHIQRRLPLDHPRRMNHRIHPPILLRRKFKRRLHRSFIRHIDRRRIMLLAKCGKLLLNCRHLLRIRRPRNHFRPRLRTSQRYRPANPRCASGHQYHFSRDIQSCVRHDFLQYSSVFRRIIRLSRNANKLRVRIPIEHVYNHTVICGRRCWSGAL